MDQKQISDTAELQCHYPPFKHSLKIILIPLIVAVIIFFAINTVLMPVLGMEPIQNEDEEGALTALLISLAVSTVGAIVGAIITRQVVKKAEFRAYAEKCREIRRAAAEEQKRLRLQAEANARFEKEQEEWRQTYRVCEFCGGELEFNDIKGHTHESSYQDGYKLEINSSTTGTLRENRVHYSIHTGTESYRCPHCHYYISVNYEMFNGVGALKAYTKKNLYGKPEEMKVSREEIENGRLFSAFKITKSQIWY